ncbi:small nuclear ribonucleoprotein [Theileria orientalis strain Shintoku]|uniref:Small nuclear ribonucleoprotein E n=1 Tax=Theileria orientalis strain Shintoku TaxID=869250 RepID=J4CDI5_THEOR|nr:small nuclear ribonucleoprotein [Theileria orientalis strain Shintoku]BAM41202.1 small nuclear ribonucleoprotein [Theileria orientalis strain Shintoku]|eukprot:XP_009691503.1 small nuclear ribonucleoprotein [Theileria orientalis strain Shintoku]
MVRTEERRDKLQKIMTQPINQIFRFFTGGTRVQIWLFEQPYMKIEGTIRGFDEYMNMVLDDAQEVYMKKNLKKDVGRILLKGDCMTLITAASSR